MGGLSFVYTSLFRHGRQDDKNFYAHLSCLISTIPHSILPRPILIFECLSAISNTQLAATINPLLRRMCSGTSPEKYIAGRQ